MKLHKDSGSLRVIIDVSYSSADEFIDFIENEQCQFIESLGVDGLKKFEWYVNEETNTATLIEEFDNAESCLLYTSPSPRDRTRSRMPSSA